MSRRFANRLKIKWKKFKNLKFKRKDQIIKQIYKPNNKVKDIKGEGQVGRKEKLWKNGRWEEEAE